VCKIWCPPVLLVKFCSPVLSKGKEIVCQHELTRDARATIRSPTCQIRFGHRNYAIRSQNHEKLIFSDMFLLPRFTLGGFTFGKFISRLSRFSLSFPFPLLLVFVFLLLLKALNPHRLDSPFNVFVYQSP